MIIDMVTIQQLEVSEHFKVYTVNARLTSMLPHPRPLPCDCRDDAYSSWYVCTSFHAGIPFDRAALCYEGHIDTSLLPLPDTVRQTQKTKLKLNNT